MTWIIERVIILSFWLFWAPSLHAEHHEVSVAVRLKPMGEFSVTAPAISGKLKKNGERFEAKELGVPLEALRTGISLRDEHLRKRLGWPEEKVVLVREVVVEKEKGVATITINKITSPIHFKIIDRSEKVLKVTFPLRLVDFAIKDVRYLNVGVEDEVMVEATVPYES